MPFMQAYLCDQAITACSAMSACVRLGNAPKQDHNALSLTPYLRLNLHATHQALHYRSKEKPVLNHAGRGQEWDSSYAALCRITSGDVLKPLVAHIG